MTLFSAMKLSPIPHPTEKNSIQEIHQGSAYTSIIPHKFYVTADQAKKSPQPFHTCRPWPYGHGFNLSDVSLNPFFFDDMTKEFHLFLAKTTF